MRPPTADGMPLNIVHRDVSPSNILVGADGIARIVDFGIANATRRIQRETQPGDIKGKPLYIAPEQWTGDHVTSRTDIYAAGLVLWQLIAGRHPFADSEPMNVPFRAVAGISDPPSLYAREAAGSREDGRLQVLPASRLGSLSPEERERSRRLDEIVARALARDPEQRYRTAKEMALALEQLRPAAQSTVGQWVKDQAERRLSSRAQMVREIEAYAVPAEPPPSTGGEIALEGAPRQHRGYALPSAAAHVPVATAQGQTTHRGGAGVAGTRHAVAASESTSLRRSQSIGGPTAATPNRSGTIRIGWLATTPLRPGDVAPDIDAVDTEGERVVLSKAQKRCVVVSFFPGAFSRSCTRQAHMFRDNYRELLLAGAHVVGIGDGDHETLQRFAAATGIPFPMIADPDGRIARAYRVAWPVIGRPKRVTFLLDRSLRVLVAFHREVNITRQRDEVLAFVDGFARSWQVSSSAKASRG